MKGNWFHTSLKPLCFVDQFNLLLTGHRVSVFTSSKEFKQCFCFVLCRMELSGKTIPNLKLWAFRVNQNEAIASLARGRKSTALSGHFLWQAQPVALLPIFISNYRWAERRLWIKSLSGECTANRRIANIYKAERWFKLTRLIEINLYQALICFLSSKPFH